MKEARMRVGDLLMPDTKVFDDDVQSMDTTHYEEFIYFLEEFLGPAGILAGFPALLDFFWKFVTNASSSWSTRNMPGSHYKFSARRLHFMLGSGLRWTLLLNGLRCTCDTFARYDGTPLWLLVQGDNTSAAGDLRHNPLYEAITGINFTGDLHVGYVHFCGQIFMPYTDEPTPDVIRLLGKFLSAPFPIQRDQFNQRVKEVKQALCDLLPATLEAKAACLAANKLHFPAMPTDAFDILYDYALALSRASADFWFGITRTMFLHPTADVWDTLATLDLHRAFKPSY